MRSILTAARCKHTLKSVKTCQSTSSEALKITITRLYVATLHNHFYSAMHAALDTLLSLIINS